MASVVYPQALKHFAIGDIIWKASGGSVIKVTAIDLADYTYNASHEYMNTNTVPAAAKVGSPATLTLIDAASGGVCDANDLSPAFTGLTGDPFEALIVWKDGGGGGTTVSGTTDLLLFFIDSGTGLPFTPNSGNVNITWDAAGIATI